MSFREYLHEKAEESRHNETLAYLMFVAGTIFFVGGILETLSLTNAPNWFLIIPYQAMPVPGGFLGLALVISGISLAIFGVIAGFLYSHTRGWYLNELQKANSMEETMLEEKSSKSKSRKINVKT
jgi:hypothetical protein